MGRRRVHICKVFWDQPCPQDSFSERPRTGGGMPGLGTLESLQKPVRKFLCPNKMRLDPILGSGPFRADDRERDLSPFLTRAV